MQREILNQVATGKITAAEGAARLESLEATEPALPAAPETVVARSGDTRRIKVTSQIGSTEIVGDPTVDFAIAEGPHRARQDGDTMVIEQAGFDDNDHFTFSSNDRKLVINGVDIARRKLRVRVNPDLPLSTSVNAGSLRIEGVRGPITGEVLAGNCKIAGFAAPLDMTIQAGNLSASGRLDAAASKIRCEMGNVTINLEPGSSVRVTARTTMSPSTSTAKSRLSSARAARRSRSGPVAHRSTSTAPWATCGCPHDESPAADQLPRLQPEAGADTPELPFVQHRAVRGL